MGQLKHMNADLVRGNCKNACTFSSIIAKLHAQLQNNCSSSENSFISFPFLLKAMSIVESHMYNYKVMKVLLDWLVATNIGGDLRQHKLFLETACQWAKFEAVLDNPKFLEIVQSMENI